MNLTPQLSEQTGLPETIKGTLEADARSDAVSASPLRSRHDGKMTFTLTDGAGERSLATVNINIDGEADGSPTEGLGQAMKRFLDAASLLTRPAIQRLDDASAR